MRRGETALLHTASGGVGIMAIQICKALGVDIIATAGSRRKRAYLRTAWGIKNVFDSRSLSFAKDIQVATGGKGVNLVLNSLTGVGYKEASMSILAKNGRFIEMSKINIWTEEEVRALRPDVEYAAVDLSEYQATRWRRLIDNMKEWVWSGRAQPMPFTLFGVEDFREALTTQQRARQIGKVGS